MCENTLCYTRTILFLMHTEEILEQWFLKQGHTPAIGCMVVSDGHRKQHGLYTVWPHGSAAGIEDLCSFPLSTPGLGDDDNIVKCTRAQGIILV